MLYIRDNMVIGTLSFDSLIVTFGTVTRNQGWVPNTVHHQLVVDNLVI